MERRSIKVPAVTTARLLTPTHIVVVAPAGRLDTSVLVTHEFALSDMEAAYRTFADPASTGALEIAAFRDGFRDERTA